MKSVSIAEAKAHLSEIVDEVAAGGEVEITRRGKRVATLVAPERMLKRVDVAALRAVTDKMQMQSEPAGDFMRRVREEDRY